jgi:hypothetical protein
MYSPSKEHTGITINIFTFLETYIHKDEYIHPPRNRQAKINIFKPNTYRIRVYRDLPLCSPSRSVRAASHTRLQSISEFFSRVRRKALRTRKVNLLLRDGRVVMEPLLALRVATLRVADNGVHSMRNDTFQSGGFR